MDGIFSILPRDPLEKPRHLCRHLGLTPVLPVQKVTATLDPGEAYIAGIQPEQGNLLVILSRKGC
jgi:hypothetical protein